MPVRGFLALGLALAACTSNANDLPTGAPPIEGDTALSDGKSDGDRYGYQLSPVCVPSDGAWIFADWYRTQQTTFFLHPADCQAAYLATHPHAPLSSAIQLALASFNGTVCEATPFPQYSMPGVQMFPGMLDHDIYEWQTWLVVRSPDLPPRWVRADVIDNYGLLMGGFYDPDGSGQSTWRIGNASPPVDCTTP